MSYHNFCSINNTLQSLTEMQNVMEDIIKLIQNEDTPYEYLTMKLGVICANMVDFSRPM